MIVNKRGGIFPKTDFVFIIAIVLSIACGANVQAAPATSIKPPSTQREVKQDLGEWKKVIEAAKKEGKIVISGAPGEEWRKSLADMFQQEYPEIAVDFSAGSAQRFWPRIRQERELGKKLWDLRLGGIDTLTFEAKRDGFLAPVRPLLLPEIADDNKWIGGIEGMFSDREKKYLLGYILYITASAYVNRDFIKESDLKNTGQLLDPKFRGKIVITTPTGGSSQNSLNHMAFMYGANFIRKLLSEQDVIITDDTRQQTEWVVRGKYPIAIGNDPTFLIPFRKQGLGKNVVQLEDKISRLSVGYGTISLLEGAPHLNAARVYINWLLSQKTQIMLTQNIQRNSSRTDVAPVVPEYAVDPAELSKYRNSAKEEAVDFDSSMLTVIKEALKK